MRILGRGAAALAAALVLAGCEGATGFTGSVVTVAQGRGSIGGNVTADGAGLGGVQVIAIGARQDSTLTDGTGAYRFAPVIPGQYTVVVQVPLGLQLAPGETGSRSVTVVSASTATANFALQSSPGA